MKAMILAAGRGKRMGELTQNIPKPLLTVNGQTLIEHQIQRLKANGFDDIVINLGYLGEQISRYLGDGSRYAVQITYSVEPQTGLETGGGVLHALPLLGKQPFLLTNADVYCDYPYAQLRQQQPQGIHLVLVDNPSFKSTGDFSLHSGCLQIGNDLTFSGISVINPQIFSQSRPGFFPIAPLFQTAIASHQATAEHYQGQWFDVGTPQRLAAVHHLCKEKS